MILIFLSRVFFSKENCDADPRGDCDTADGG